MRQHNTGLCVKLLGITSLNVAAKSLQSCPTLCNPTDSSPPGFTIPGILQARTLEWVAVSFSSAWKWSESEVAQSCPTLWDPIDCSLPGSSVHGIFQARVLEWGAIAFSSHHARFSQISLDSQTLFIIYLKVYPFINLSPFPPPTPSRWQPLFYCLFLWV